MTNTNPSTICSQVCIIKVYEIGQSWTVPSISMYNIDHEKVVILLDGNLWAPSVGYKQSLLYFSDLIFSEYFYFNF